MTEARRDRKPVLAVVGATGVVGQTLLSMLATRPDVWGEVRLLASGHSHGATARALGRDLPIQELGADAFDDVDVCVLAVPADVARTWAPIIAERGAVVIDNSGSHTLNPAVPLVVPEINPHAAAGDGGRIIASPSGTTLLMINALATLHEGWGLREVVASTYQAVSDSGVRGVHRLYDETAQLAGNRGVGQTPGDVRRFLSDLEAEPSPFPAPVAFNVIPWVGGPGDGRWSSTELRAREEVRSILGLADLRMSTTCVQVPVTTTHSASLHLTFERRVTRVDATRALTEGLNSVVVLDDPMRAEWPTPVDVVGTDPVFVGRIRQPSDFPRSLELFVCTDNLRKGSALNMIQLAELVVR